LECLSPKLREIDDVVNASDYRNIFIRILHMFLVFFRYYNNTRFVLINTDSNLAFYYVLVIAKLGKGVLVAAVAIVKGDFPDSVVIGGVPARIIKH